MTRALLLLVLAAFVAPAAAQSLGRLFYTPEQRQALTQARLRGTPLPDDAALPAAAMPTDPTAVAGMASSAVPAPIGPMPADADASVGASSGPRVSPQALLNGVVERPTGRVAWLDGIAVANGDTWRGYRVEVGTRGVRLHRAGEPPRALGVGQTLDLATGEVRGTIAPDAVQRSRR